MVGSVVEVVVVVVAFFRVWSRSRHWWGSTARTVDRSINGDVGGGIVVMDNLQDGRVCVSYLASCCVGVCFKSTLRCLTHLPSSACGCS